jgi:hypothetical protein
MHNAMMSKLRIAVAAAAMILSSGAALAQSNCSALVFGAVLTAGQWNQCFSAKQDLLGYTSVNKAGDVMGGRLATIASTVTRAGLAILPGVAPTAPVDGDIWLTTAGVFARIAGSTIGPFTATGSSVPAVIQGDILFGSAPATISALAKSASATRYLANTGTSNNPAWGQVNLANGVTGALPYANLPAGTQDTILGYFSSTAVSAATLSNCATALTYNTTTHAFGCAAGAGTGTVTSVGLANSYGLTISGSPVTTTGSITAGIQLTTVTNSLSGNVNLTNTATYFDGPSVAQGTTAGQVWLATGAVTVIDSVGVSLIDCKLWDGTTIIASGEATVSSQAANQPQVVHLSGLITSPAANIKVSCKDVSRTTGSILFNVTGNSKDSTLSAIRIQ